MAGWVKGRGLSPVLPLPVQLLHAQTLYSLPSSKPTLKTGSDYFPQQVECLHDPDVPQPLFISWRDEFLAL